MPKNAPNFDSAYQLLKNSYPLKLVQQYWESLETSDDIYGSQKAFQDFQMANMRRCKTPALIGQS